MMTTTRREKIDDILKDFVISDEELAKVSSILLDQFNKGLNPETQKDSSVKMLPTFVRDVPNGTEKGIFLGLDLGGSRFRILRMDLKGKMFCMVSKTCEIPASIMVGTGASLFDCIADCLRHFMDEYSINAESLPLGFTFSFPCVQEGLTSAILIEWTKGFACSGVVGKDVVKLLREALDRRCKGIVGSIAVVNDTTGTLMSCAHVNDQCRVGLIIGTGTNACYMENLENVGTWKGDKEDPKQVIINTEWGAFGDNGCLEFIRTAFDNEIDESSVNGGKQLFEKMVSGMYIGELVRRIISKLSDEELCFRDNLSLKFLTPYSFKTKYISFIESAHDVKEIRAVLDKMDVNQPTDEDCMILLQVCKIVSTRSAHLVAAGVSTILNKMQRPYTVVGVDGSVYRYHPSIKDVIKEKIEVLTNPDYKFRLMLSQDGSGRGAALVSAVANRTNTEEEK